MFIMFLQNSCSSVLPVFCLAAGSFYTHFYIHWASQDSYLPLRLDPTAGQLPWHADSTRKSHSDGEAMFLLTSRQSPIETVRRSFSIQSPQLQRQMLSQMQGREDAAYLFSDTLSHQYPEVTKTAILGRKGGVTNRRCMDVGPPTKSSPRAVEL